MLKSRCVCQILVQLSPKHGAKTTTARLMPSLFCDIALPGLNPPLILVANSHWRSIGAGSG